MRIIVINNKSEYYHREFHVSKMNYDCLIVKDGDKNIEFKIENVDLISDSLLEDVIIKYRDIIKIKLNRGIHLLLYTKLINFIEENINSKVENLEVLSDDYGLIRKNLWEKNIKVVINDATPLQINVVGRNFDKNFDINIKNINIQDFIEECSFEIEKNKVEIEEKLMDNKRCEKALKNVIDNLIKKNEENLVCMLP